jgi:hypothetical protein
MLFYLSRFFPVAYRGCMVGTFMVATAFSAVFGAPPLRPLRRIRYPSAQPNDRAEGNHTMTVEFP